MTSLDRALTSLSFPSPPTSWTVSEEQSPGPGGPQDVGLRGRGQPPPAWTAGHPGRTQGPELQLSSPPAAN